MQANTDAHFQDDVCLPLYSAQTTYQIAIAATDHSAGKDDAVVFTNLPLGLRLLLIPRAAATARWLL